MTSDMKKEKLALLRTLAAEGFDELDQGRGTIIDSEPQLRKHIGQIGRRAIQTSKRAPPGR
jgi:hypothetical protein